MRSQGEEHPKERLFLAVSSRKERESNASWSLSSRAFHFADFFVVHRCCMSLYFPQTFTTPPPPPKKKKKKKKKAHRRSPLKIPPCMQSFVKFERPSTAGISSRFFFTVPVHLIFSHVFFNFLLKINKKKKGGEIRQGLVVGWWLSVKTKYGKKKDKKSWRIFFRATVVIVFKERRAKRSCGREKK